MNYIFLGRNGDFHNPESVIVSEGGKYYKRRENTDWEFLEDIEIQKIELGTDNRYYEIDDASLDQIISSWSGSRYGYRNIETEDVENDIRYGEEYD